ncbi:DUF2218 domain-containing protein [Consotaella aegiceratis]|uniref:DUF2218 domain-containing protein n=1 Tax=Consotaella aegiceratis TaxID=3097961 RepID=UPI002F3FF176
MFDYGDLRLVILAMIAERPRHGYELIKAIADHSGGRYTPSPGVIYPTLAWLDDVGYAAIDTREAGRKTYRITAEGEAFLSANRAAVEYLMSRRQTTETHEAPFRLIRSMKNLKRALHRRLEHGPIDEAAAETIAAAIDAAAQTLEIVPMNDQPPSDLPAKSVAEVATPSASKYLQQLCKHFQNKRPVTFDPSQGQIAFSIGECRLEAGNDVLTMKLAAPDETQLAQLQDVVERHLVRFAFREEMQIDWRPA